MYGNDSLTLKTYVLTHFHFSMWHIGSMRNTVLDNLRSFSIMADTHNAIIMLFSSLHMISKVRKWFLDPENLCFDTSLTSLCGILTVLDDFPSFGIMVDAHYASIKGFSLSYIISKVRKLFLDPENLWFDTSLISLCGILTILDNFPSFGIIRPTLRTLIMQSSKLPLHGTRFLMPGNDSLALKTYDLAPLWLLYVAY